MTITERLMKPGRFHLELNEDYPNRIASAIDFYDHIVITPVPVDLILDDAGMLAQAIYTGVVTSRPSRRIIEGHDLSWWLGTDAGVGDLIETLTGPSGSAVGTADLTSWINGLRPASLAAGTVTNTVDYTGAFQWVTRREAYDAVCQAVGAEWRVNPDGTVDAGSRAVLFEQPTPSSGVVVTRKREGLDGALRGLDGSLMVPAADVEQFTTKVFVLTEATTDPANPFVNASASISPSPYRDFRNNEAVMERIVDGNGVTDAGAIASAQLALNSVVRREISLSSDTYTITRFVRPGDDVWVYDIDAGLVDPANVVAYRGELITPLELRVHALTWPLEDGCGVYARRSAATPVYTDLTPYVQWETGDVQWEVGAGARITETGVQW